MASLVPVTDDSRPSPAASDQVLFCPFCREDYEGETSCPVHELPLVEFHQLPRQAHERTFAGLDEDVGPLTLGYGRGWILAGGLLLLLSFVLPFASAVRGDERVTWSALTMALQRDPRLWTLPFAGGLFLSILLRRRTPRQMYGARLASLGMALLVPVSFGYPLYRVFRGAAEQGIDASAGYGVYVAAAATVLLIVGSWKLGRAE